MLAANQKAKASDPVGRQHSVFICTFSKEKKRKAKSVRATKGRRLCSQKVAISRKQTCSFFFLGWSSLHFDIQFTALNLQSLNGAKQCHLRKSWSWNLVLLQRNLQSSFSLWSGKLNETKLDYSNLEVTGETGLHVDIHTHLPATILD